MDPKTRPIIGRKESWVIQKTTSWRAFWWLWLVRNHCTSHRLSSTLGFDIGDLYESRSHHSFPSILLPLSSLSTSTMAPPPGPYSGTSTLALVRSLFPFYLSVSLQNGRKIICLRFIFRILLFVFEERWLSNELREIRALAGRAGVCFLLRHRLWKH